MSIPIEVYDNELIRFIFSMTNIIIPKFIKDLTKALGEDRICEALGDSELLRLKLLNIL